MKKSNLFLCSILFVTTGFLFAQDISDLKFHIQKHDFAQNHIITQPENCISIKEIYENKKELNGTTVTFTAKILNVTNNLKTETTWLRLSDFTSSIIANTHEDDVPEIGEVVVIKGKININVAKKQGYFFPVLIEEAVFCDENDSE